MSGRDDPQGLWHYIVDGPHGKRTILGSAIGLALWWRTWAAVSTYLLGAAALGYFTSGGQAAYNGFFVGNITAIIMWEVWADD